MKEINESFFCTLHYLHFEKFTDSIIEFFNSNYEINENLFLLYGDKEQYTGNIDELKKIRNVIFLEEISNSYEKKLIRNSRNIVIHYMNWRLTVKIKLLTKKDLFVVFWGADIKQEETNKREKIIDKLEYYVKKHYIKKIIPINLIENDYNVLKKIFNYDFKKHYVAKYTSSIYRDEIATMPFSKSENITKILLGNSATITNQHIEMLDKLEIFKNENIELYIPLSYGDMNYGNMVEEYAKNIFGDKCHPMREFMSTEEYNKFLNTIDIAIFNNNRQQGLGNINRLLILRKKVYVNETSGMTNHYGKIGVKVFITNEFPTDFTDFIESDYQLMNQNRERMLKFLSEEEVVKQWNQSVYRERGTRNE